MADDRARVVAEVLAKTRAQRDGVPGMVWNFMQDAEEDAAAVERILAQRAAADPLRETIRADREPFLTEATAIHEYLRGFGSQPIPPVGLLAACIRRAALGDQP